MLNRSIELYAKIAKKINETIQPQDDKKHYINDTKNIIVGDTPKTFYYMYDNNQYYFTTIKELLNKIDEINEVECYLSKIENNLEEYVQNQPKKKGIISRILKRK